MNLFENILSIVIIVVLAFSLIHTFSVARQHKAVEGNVDAKISEHVQKSPYTKNPIFLAYGIFFALALFIILFFAITFY